MGDPVGVDPAALRELAGRLRRLQALLAEHAPAIRQKMRCWDSELDFALLPRLVDEALRDARDMDARAGRAHELATDQGWRPAPAGPGVPEPPAVTLDWTATGHAAGEAARDVAGLAEVQAAGDPAHALARLAELPAGLTRHLGDQAYLAAFWAEATPLALQAARVLRDRAGVAPFGAASSGVLRALGASLAAATQMRTGTGADRRPLLSAATREAIIRPADPWSVGMLFEYGPDGKAWDSDFLADMARAMLDATATATGTGPRTATGAGLGPGAPGPAATSRPAGPSPGATPLPGTPQIGGPQIGTGPIDTPPIGIPSTGTASIGAAPSGAVPGGAGLAGTDPGGAADDLAALCAVLGRASENGHAARHVLGHPVTGARYAAILVGDRPGMDGHAAEFLRAAVSAVRGPGADAEESARSVAAIVQATAAFAAARPGAVLPPRIRAALFHVAARYLPDLAAGAGRPGVPGAARFGGRAGHPWTAVVDGAALPAFLGQALREPVDAGTLRGLLDARQPLTVAATALDPDGTDHLGAVARLHEVVDEVERALGLDAAGRAAVAAARRRASAAAAARGSWMYDFTGPWSATAVTRFLTGAAPVSLAESVVAGAARLPGPRTR
ncbi:hypothetical protein Sru01_57180 [Sphaerisporangium rufum]|uniref:Uncharacterized protein n=1 Tax=Sphaerisporangium rufum TaxID=1381558 RepID=A0A919R6T0_9ACTN|nr:hypothetical protein [Sphaerisporangium rufum]GII80736.1 hypothetical protein Sru01_57180 [Sphaerisporangium rufum]